MRYEDWMSPSDSIMWHIERDPVLRSTVTMLWRLDRDPDPDAFRAAFVRAAERVPRLRQRVVADPVGFSTPRWVETPDFSVDDHLHLHADTGDDWESVVAEANRLHSVPFDRRRPLWEAHLFSGLDDGGAALVARIHHAVADGVGLIEMSAAIVDLERDPAETQSSPESTHDRAAPHLAPHAPHVVHAVAHRMQVDARLSVRVGTGSMRTAARLATGRIGVRKATTTAASVVRLLRPANTPLSPIMVDRSQTYSLRWIDFPLERFVAAARATGSSLNDVFVASAIGGVDLYHDLHGEIADEVRVNMPISIRDGDDGAGNRFVPSRFVITAGIVDPVERLRRYRRRLREVTNEPHLRVFDQVTDVINRLGPAASTALLSSMMKAVDVTLSNVPGVDVPLYVAGARITQMVPFGPCAGAAINITLLSYDGTVTIGISADDAAVPDVDKLTDGIRRAAEEILALA